MVMVFLFLKVQYDKDMSFGERLRRIDYGGNFLLVASSVSILYGHTYGGNMYNWVSPQILVSLLVGFGGIVLFVLFENTIKITVPETDEPAVWC